MQCINFNITLSKYLRFFIVSFSCFLLTGVINSAKAEPIESVNIAANTKKRIPLNKDAIKNAPLYKITRRPTLQIMQRSVDSQKWGTTKTINSPQVIMFRWGYYGVDAKSAYWQLSEIPFTSDKKPQLIANGLIPNIPQQGKVGIFKIALSNHISKTPPAISKNYYVRVAPLDANSNYIESPSLPVTITYTRPGAVTAFTNIGLVRPYDIKNLLESARSKYDLPSMGAAVVGKNGVISLDVTGIRQYGHKTLVVKSDAWHIGSDTKAMTATLFGIFVEKYPFTVNWNSKLVDFYPEYKNTMNPAYKDITMKMLLAHTAGLPANQSEEEDIIINAMESSRPMKRQFLLRSLIHRNPSYPPGSKYQYSNVGYVMVGAVLEKISGKSWEQLMEAELFRPLGMNSASFGPPGSAITHNMPDQPRGHIDEPGTGSTKYIRKPTYYENCIVCGPAGTVHTNLNDWAKFIRLHLNGSQGNLKLSDDTIDMLHAPFFPKLENYGGGWGTDVSSGTLSHDGSDGKWYARAYVNTKKGFGVLVTTNVGGSKANNDNPVTAVGEVVNKLISYYSQ
jgi:CubicO group peptidase (beta-lactamase class C family)